MSKTPREWHLRSHLAALLVVTMVLATTLISSTLLAYRAPEIDRETLHALQDEVRQTSDSLELLLTAAQSRLETLELLLDDATAEQAATFLDGGLQGLGFAAVYRLSPQGRVLGLGLPAPLQNRQHALLDRDLASDTLFRAVSTGPAVAWSGNYTSPLTGMRAAGIAVRDRHGHVLIAETPVSALLKTMDVAAGKDASAIWVVERSGEIVADTRQGRDVGRFNVRDWPLMQALLAGREPAARMEFQGTGYHVSASHAKALDWFFVGRAPAGLDNPRVQSRVLLVAACLFGCLVVGLLMAPFWANRIVRPLEEIDQRAAQAVLAEDAGQPWPRGPVAEFNQLASDLAQMALSLQLREQKSHAIFHASPVPMCVTEALGGDRILDVNQAWCNAFLQRREDAVGSSSVALGIWAARDRAAFAAAMGADTSVECSLVRGNGQAMQARVFVRPASMGRERWLIWAIVDIGPLRRVEQALRELNQGLEAHVLQRTQALQASNDALSSSLARLQQTHEELVRTEKMAALGSLVAGVSHELNTPLGNGVLAISAIADATRRFRAGMQGGVRRADLAHLVESLEVGTGIAERNLLRASDLVQSFKQVAIDQTSAQRRRFELGDVVHEMVVSLRPGLLRTPYRIEVQVPGSGLALDSHPGALGQVLGHLILNAVQHGFDGRDAGTVRVSAAPDGEAHVVLRVADDGVGIAAADIDRVFDAFMTTRMGRGGIGLGLHIGYNAVVKLLGGTLAVASVPGEGTTFTMRLPREAPGAPLPAPETGTAAVPGVA